MISLQKLVISSAKWDNGFGELKFNYVLLINLI